MDVIARLATPKTGAFQLQIDILDKYNENDIGNPVRIYEVIDSRKMPVYSGFLNLNVAENNDSMKWFTLKSLAKTINEDGNYITKSKTNSDGQFMNENLEIVESEDEATKDYALDKVNGKNFYIQKASLYLNNESPKGKPYKQTLVSIKYYTENESSHIRSLSDLAKIESDEEKKRETVGKIKSLKSEYGTYHTLFINKGEDFFRANGFEVKDKDISHFKKKKNYFGDNVPF